MSRRHKLSLVGALFLHCSTHLDGDRFHYAFCLRPRQLVALIREIHYTATRLVGFSGGLGLTLKRYIGAPLSARLALGMSAAIVLNAIYCLAYRYASGNPATLFEAFSWGTINIAPWVAAFEIGRSMANSWRLALVFLAALVVSLCLDVAAYPGPLSAFDFVKRVPGACLAIIAIAIFRWARSRLGSEAEQPAEATEYHGPYDWVRSAGNYVEVHRDKESVAIIRGTLAGFVKVEGDDLVRIHRQYAVRPSSVERLEESHVLLSSGDRLPIGRSYRGYLNQQASFTPSSQSG